MGTYKGCTPHDLAPYGWAFACSTPDPRVNPTSSLVGPVAVALVVITAHYPRLRRQHRGVETCPLMGVSGGKWRVSGALYGHRPSAILRRAAAESHYAPHVNCRAWPIGRCVMPG